VDRRPLTSHLLRLRISRTRAGILALALLLVGCSPSEGPAGVFIQNDLDSSVRLTYIVDGAERSLADELHGDRVAPGERVEFMLDLYNEDGSNGCTRGEIVARTDEGVEVARIPPPACLGDVQPLSEWAIPSPSG